MWFILFPTKIVKQRQHKHNTKKHRQPRPQKIIYFFSAPHLRFFRQMLLPNMRPVRNKHSCAKPPTRRQQWKNAIAKTVLILACGSYGLSANATDSSRESSTIYSFNIPSVKVEQALSQLAEQTGHQLLFSYALVNSLQSTAVKGDHTAPNALQLMLQKTPLTGHFTERGVIIITDANARNNTDQGRGNMNNKTTFTKRKNVLAAMVGLFAATGAAQQAYGQDGEAATAQGRIDEIVVTASKREQSLQDVPISITAITGEKLEQAGIQNIVDLSYAVPNLSVTEFGGPGGSLIIIRGAGNVRGSSPLTGVYLDEAAVSILPIAALDLQAIDLQRVEVLRGPQGTLYGQGSVGGTVRFITSDPTFDGINGSMGWSGYGTKKGGTSNELTGVANLPVIDDVLAFRVAATYKDTAGWIDQPAAGAEDINDSELSNIRIKGLWQASDDMTVKATVIRHRNNAGGNTVNLGPRGDSNFQSSVDRSLINRITDDYDLYNLTVNYDLGFASLISASSYVDIEKLQAGYNAQVVTLAALPTAPLGVLLPDYRSEAEVFTQEVRLGSNDNDSSFDWTLGVFYSDSDIDAGFSSVELAGPITVTAGGSNNNDLSETVAYFGELSYAFTDRLTLGVGTRYFEDDREQRNLISGLTQKETFDKLSSKAYLSFSLTEDATLYTSVAEGFRSGGFNSPGVPAYEPESMLTYEFGVKAMLFDRRLNTELALFYSEYKDYQAQTIDLSVAPSFITKNPGDVDIQGVEWNVDWAATEQLLVGFSGSITDAEIAKINSLPATLIVGDSPDLVPEYNYSLKIDYSFDWSGATPGVVRIDYNRQGPTVSINRTAGWLPPVVKSEPINFLNAYVGAEWDSIGIELFGRNLLDEDEATTAALTGIGTQARPRTVGIRLNYSF